MARDVQHVPETVSYALGHFLEQPLPGCLRRADQPRLGEQRRQPRPRQFLEQFQVRQALLAVRDAAGRSEQQAAIGLGAVLPQTQSQRAGAGSDGERVTLDQVLFAVEERSEGQVVKRPGGNDADAGVLGNQRRQRLPQAVVEFARGGVELLHRMLVGRRAEKRDLGLHIPKRRLERHGDRSRFAQAEHERPGHVQLVTHVKVHQHRRLLVQPLRQFLGAHRAVPPNGHVIRSQSGDAVPDRFKFRGHRRIDLAGGAGSPQNDSLDAVEQSLLPLQVRHRHVGRPGQPSNPQDAAEQAPLQELGPLESHRGAVERCQTVD